MEIRRIRQTEAGAVTVRFTAACDAPPTGPGEPVAPGVRRYRLGTGTSAQVVQVFPGGCATLRPERGSGPSATLMRQAEQAVTFQTRDALREALRRRSDGRLQLDP